MNLMNKTKQATRKTVRKIERAVGMTPARKTSSRKRAVGRKGVRASTTSRAGKRIKRASTTSRAGKRIGTKRASRARTSGSAGKRVSRARTSSRAAKRR